MARKPRDYDKEYRDYQGTPEQKKRRAQRNAARRKAMREGKVRKGDGKEVDHTDHENNSGSLDNSRVRIVSRKENRSHQPSRKRRT